MLPFWRGYPKKRSINGEGLYSSLISSNTSFETKEQIALKNDVKKAIGDLLADYATLQTVCGASALSIDFVLSSKSKKIERLLFGLQQKTPHFYELLSKLHVSIHASVNDEVTIERMLKDHRINEFQQSLPVILDGLSSAIPGSQNEFSAALQPIINYTQIVADPKASLSALREFKLTEDLTANIQSIKKTIEKLNYDTSTAASVTRDNFYTTTFPGLIDRVSPELKNTFNQFDALMNELKAFREDKKNPASAPFVTKTLETLRAMEIDVRKTYETIMAALTKEYHSHQTVKNAFTPFFQSLQSAAAALATPQSTGESTFVPRAPSFSSR